MKDVTEAMANYIKTQGISLSEVEEKLRVPREKLEGRGKEKLSADEFLRLCAFLHIAPEAFYEYVDGMDSK